MTTKLAAIHAATGKTRTTHGWVDGDDTNEGENP